MMFTLLGERVGVEKSHIFFAVHLLLPERIGGIADVSQTLLVLLHATNEHVSLQDEQQLVIPSYSLHEGRKHLPTTFNFVDLHSRTNIV